MTNQRTIARILGISQGAVSLGLRGDPSISAGMRKRIKTTAKRLGYCQNVYVSALMSRIGSGRKVSERGTIALVVDVLPEKKWREHRTYGACYEEITRRCAELGFGLECFFLQAPGMNAEKIDRIIYARGIPGLILAPPYRSNRVMAIQWNRYACIGIGYGWEDQQFDRVANDHHQNTILACQKLSELGYLRIGLSLPRFLLEIQSTRWLSGFLTYQYSLPFGRRLPIFHEKPGESSSTRFQEWYRKWRPDVILSLSGSEKVWLDAMHLTVPGDVGLAALTLNPGSSYSGVKEGTEQLSATAVDLVAAQIIRNEFGLPSKQKLTLIEGQWKDGNSLRKAISIGIRRKKS